MGFLGSSLRVESLALLVGGFLRGVGRERLTHVLVPLALLVDQMVSGSDVVVSVGFKASDRILFFELKVTDEPVEEVFREGHLLKTGEKARLTRLLTKFLLC